MSQPKGSVGVALGVAIIIVVAVTSIGYYQFVSCTQATCATTTQASTTTAAVTCTPPACVTIQIVVGAATAGPLAYSPDQVKLVIGVNNTFEVHNNDSQSGGVIHSLTAKNCTPTCPFDTGLLNFNQTAGPFTLTTPGTYPFYCQVHPTTMNGTITVVAGSGGSTPPPTTSSTTSKSNAAPAGLAITILKGSSTNQNAPGFSPDTATVVIGVNNTVTWTNNDTAGHTVAITVSPSGAKTSDSDVLGPGQSFTLTLSVAGSYTYVSTLQAWMKGTIVVKS